MNLYCAMTVFVMSIKSSTEVKQILIWPWKYGTGTGRKLRKYCYFLCMKSIKSLFVPSCKYSPTKQDLVALGPGRAQRKWTVFTKKAVHHFEPDRLVRSYMTPLSPTQQENESQETPRPWDLGAVQPNTACSQDPEHICRGYWNCDWVKTTLHFSIGISTAFKCCPWTDAALFHVCWGALHAYRNFRNPSSTV